MSTAVRRRVSRGDRNFDSGNSNGWRLRRTPDDAHCGRYPGLIGLPGLTMGGDDEARSRAFAQLSSCWQTERSQGDT